jgi:hypothetical protein
LADRQLLQVRVEIDHEEHDHGQAHHGQHHGSQTSQYEHKHSRPPAYPVGVRSPT